MIADNKKTIGRFAAGGRAILGNLFCCTSSGRRGASRRSIAFRAFARGPLFLDFSRAIMLDGLCARRNLSRHTVLKNRRIDMLETRGGSANLYVG